MWEVKHWGVETAALTARDPIAQTQTTPSAKDSSSSLCLLLPRFLINRSIGLMLCFLWWRSQASASTQAGRQVPK